eukprot:5059191-Prymnesium_polylepis.1
MCIRDRPSRDRWRGRRRDEHEVTGGTERLTRGCWRLSVVVLCAIAVCLAVYCTSVVLPLLLLLLYCRTWSVQVACVRVCDAPNWGRCRVSGHTLGSRATREPR